MTLGTLMILMPVAILATGGVIFAIALYFARRAPDAPGRGTDVAGTVLTNSGPSPAE